MREIYKLDNLIWQFTGGKLSKGTVTVYSRISLLFGLIKFGYRVRTEHVFRDQVGVVFYNRTKAVVNLGIIVPSNHNSIKIKL